MSRWCRRATDRFRSIRRSAATSPWRFIAGAIWLLHEIGVDSGGWRAAVTSDIPMGAGLSSSAAIEVATVLAVLEQRGLAWPPIDIARIGQRVENEIVGLPSGIMDQFISAGAVAGHASLLDCDASPSPVPDPERREGRRDGHRNAPPAGRRGLRRSSQRLPSRRRGARSSRAAWWRTTPMTATRPGCGSVRPPPGPGWPEARRFRIRRPRRRRAGMRRLRRRRCRWPSATARLYGGTRRSRLERRAPRPTRVRPARPTR